jgi:hypothetical protein
VSLITAALIAQIITLLFVIYDGFTTTPVLGPEAPRELRRYLLGDAAVEFFANYYANSYDQSFALQNKLARRLRNSANLLAISILLFVVGVVGILRFGEVQTTRPSSQVISPTPSPARAP